MFEFDTKMENGRAGMPRILEMRLAGQANTALLIITGLCLQDISTTTTHALYIRGRLHKKQASSYHSGS